MHSIIGLLRTSGLVKVEKGAATRDDSLNDRLVWSGPLNRLVSTIKRLNSQIWPGSGRDGADAESVDDEQLHCTDTIVRIIVENITLKYRSTFSISLLEIN